MDFSELVTIGFSAVLAIGGIKVLFSSFDDDDDEDGGGTGEAGYEPSFAAAIG